MIGPCGEFDRAQDAGLLGTPAVQEHLRGCEACALAANELQRLDGALRDLARRDASTSRETTALWQALETRLDRPSWRDRLPLATADAVRLAGAWAQPPVAAAWATGIAGVCFGLWLGRAGAVADTSAVARPYEATSLVDDDQAGVAALFTESFNTDDDGGDSTGSQ